VISSSQGLCYLPWVAVMMEKFLEWTVLAGETEVLGENPPRLHFVHHKSHLSDPGANPGRRVGSHRLTASDMARPTSCSYPFQIITHHKIRRYLTSAIGKVSLDKPRKS
jgi:hypothetical protein